MLFSKIKDIIVREPEDYYFNYVDLDSVINVVVVFMG
ncbi:Uncharacterised protein [Elizabethkingia meningoseptica]|nr:Uncharacterised protein [Elizabethkingia meningoseptica]